MFKTRYYAKRSLGLFTFGNTICKYFAFYCLIILFVGSCQNPTHNEKGKQLLESIISDAKLIKSNYSSCLSYFEAEEKVADICAKEKTEIRMLHKKTKVNLSTLANLRKEGALSTEEYNFYIERINEELEDVRELSNRLREKGVSIRLE